MRPTQGMGEKRGSVSGCKTDPGKNDWEEACSQINHKVKAAFRRETSKRTLERWRESGGGDKNS